MRAYLETLTDADMTGIVRYAVEGGRMPSACAGTASSSTTAYHRGETARAQRARPFAGRTGFTMVYLLE